MIESRNKKFYDADEAVAHCNPIDDSKPTLMLYMTHECDQYQIERVDALAEIFAENFLLVWDSKNGSWHEFGNVQTISEQEITDTRRFSHQCCAQEKTIMWLIEHIDDYSYAWVMENDVWFKSVDVLKQFLSKYDDFHADLIHQNQHSQPVYDSKDWHFSYLVDENIDTRARFLPPYFKGMYNLFRVSSRLVQVLNDWRMCNQGDWTFFEPLIATITGQSKILASTPFELDAPSVKMRFRPCFTSREADILHPVKKNFLQPFWLDRERCLSELKSNMPDNSKYLLADENQLQITKIEGHHILPFTERNGVYWGPPKNSVEAIHELEKTRDDGAQFVVFCWPAFWWLRHYKDFSNHLESTYPLRYRSRTLIVYDLCRKKDNVN